MDVQQVGVLPEVPDLPLPSYQFKLGYSDDTFEKTLEKVAAFVSQIYAKFPALSQENAEILRKSGYWFNASKDVASSKECELFQAKLKETIILYLMKANSSNSKERSSLKLATDYYPEGALCEVAQLTFSKDLQIGTLFPYKTCSRIEVNQDSKIVFLDIHLKGPPF